MISAFELEWPRVLGEQPVRLEVSPRRTVLVGRNGSGKSAVLEGIVFGIARAIFQRLRLGGAPLDSYPPLHYAVEFTDAAASLLRYEYRIYSEVVGPNPVIKYSERCTRDGKPIWSVRDGMADLRGSTIALPGEMGLLAIEASPQFKLPSEALAFARALEHPWMVAASVPRSAFARVELIVSPGGEQAYTGLDFDALYTARTLVRWFRRDRERFVEFCELGRRAGVFQRPEVRIFEEGNGKGDEAVVAALLLDGANFGVVADGTLRIACLLASLLDPAAGPILLIDEPENGIHPGLLARVLAILDSYSQGRQLIVATHSSQVVNWASPEEVRLAERTGEATKIRRLSEEEVARLGTYLEDQGCLGDFVFGGGLNE